MNDIAAILRKHYIALGGTYGLTLFEKGCMLAYPALTGLCVDGLVKQSFKELVWLVCVWLLHLISTFIRHRYDTRVFMGIYADLATATALRQRESGQSLSKISARVELARDMVGFFEAEIPAIFHNTVSVVGSLAMLFVYDIHAGLMAMLVLLPMGLANTWYWRKALRVNKAINSQIEREVDILAAGGAGWIARHFRLIRRWRIALSDAESWAWVCTEITTIVALLCILVDFTQSPGFSAGAIYALLAYVYDYLEGLNGVPNIVNNIAKLKDVRNRMQV